jgi:hypothetical protein
MDRQFVNVRLDPTTSEKLSFVSRKTGRSRGLAIRLLVSVGYRLIKTKPELFFFPDDENYQTIEEEKS